jgi:hypothetical protein
MPPKKKAKLSVAWEWKNDEGSFVSFADDDCEMLEKAYATKATSFTTKDFIFNKTHKTMYEINFAKMLQINLETKAKRPIRRKSPDKPEVLYEWFTDDLTWAAFDPVDCKLLETAYSSSSATLFSTKDLTFNKGFDSLYIFDFKLMTQMNTDSGTSRKIRRRGAGTVARDDDDDEDSSYAAVVKKSDAPEPKSVRAAKAKAAGGSGKTSSMPPPPDPLSVDEIKAQAGKGPQSKRGVTKIDYGMVVSKDKHGSRCFDKMLENEARMCGEWAVFYHSYSAAALLYEVQAAVAAVLFRFKSSFAVMPRLLLKGFNDIPDAATLLTEFKKMKDRDHNPRYRAVGVCGTSALLADDSEAPAKSVFLMGYSVGPLTGVLENLLVSCGFPKSKVNGLAKEIVKLSQEHGLDSRGYGGKGCKSGRSGHLLQIFMKRELVDRYVYPAFPFGVPDTSRNPLPKYLAGNGPIKGQVRIVAHPAIFMKATYVRMYVYSADPTYHSMREAFQDKLTKLLDPILGSAEARREAAEGIFDGELPSW